MDLYVSVQYDRFNTSQIFQVLIQAIPLSYYLTDTISFHVLPAAVYMMVMVEKMLCSECIIVCEACVGTQFDKHVSPSASSSFLPAINSDS